jgi:MFS family permease
MASVYIAWVVSTAFFFYQYMLRGLPNIISKEIFDTFKVTAEEFSSLGSIYLITYGLLQIPIGFLLDRVDLRKISLWAILLSIVGALIFGISNDFYVMQISRFILAIGSAAALGITLKIISSNFQDITRSFLSGFTLTIGVLGPILGGEIVTFVLKFNDWRVAVIILGLGGFILFLLSFFFIKNVNHEKNNSGFKNIISQVKYGFSRQILLYAVIAAGIYAPVCVFGDLWGVRFLSAKFNISEGDAINICLSLYGGLAIGSLILPFLSEKLNSLNSVIIVSLLINAGLFSTLIFSEAFSIENLYILVMAIGFFCGSEMICFNAAWKIVPRDCTALTVGVINSLSLIFNGIFQHLVGILMDMMWDGKINTNGTRIYSEDNYIIGISSIPVVLLICFVIGLVLLRKSKRMTVDEK